MHLFDWNVVGLHTYFHSLVCIRTTFAKVARLGFLFGLLIDLPLTSKDEFYSIDFNILTLQDYFILKLIYCKLSIKRTSRISARLE